MTSLSSVEEKTDGETDAKIHESNSHTHTHALTLTLTLTHTRTLKLHVLAHTISPRMRETKLISKTIF